ncbi:hypothetical protein Tco_1060680, partial [Tanacetum coccineum]
MPAYQSFFNIKCKWKNHSKIFNSASSTLGKGLTSSSATFPSVVLGFRSFYNLVLLLIQVTTASST